jgi:hypothetical protein
MGFLRSEPGDVALLSRYLRPAAIFLGLGVFLLGSLVLGAALAISRPPQTYAYGGPLLLLLGVSLIGGGFVMEPSEYWIDPEIEFAGPWRYFVAGVSVLFLVLVAIVALFGA